MEPNSNTPYAPYGQANGPSAPPGDSYYPPLPVDYNDPPPPYNFPDSHDVPTNKVPQVTPQRLPQGHPQPNRPTPTTTTHPNPNGTPTIVATTNHPQPVQVILQSDLGNAVAPGVCHICKRGKIKDSATCCSWVACCFLLPFGIIPGLIAFCYACRKPKCTRCGFVHGKKK